jgi:enediyne biosynthesis protein E4
MRWMIFAFIVLVVAGGIGGAVALRSRPGTVAAPASAADVARKAVADKSLTPLSTNRPTNRATPISSASSPIHFNEIAEQLRIQFVPFTGTTPEKHFPTANGTGVAMLDYDQDGYLDLYFANASRLDGSAEAPPNALLRSRAAVRFEHVTAGSATGVSGFTQGLAVADIDNDGFPDILLVRYGPDIVLKNNGDGSFSDCTGASGLGDPRWGTSAAFFDYDEDGSLDVYIAHYGQWNLAWHDNHFCGDRQRGMRMYCSPRELTPEVHALYQSRGDGSFVDRLAELGLARTDGRGQGVVACDVNNDGHVDLYVANDMTPNFLFFNQGGGRFADYTDLSCAAYNAEGKPEAGMGVDAADVTGDGLPDLFVTNFYLEHNTLYHNLGNVLFQDVANRSGVATDSTNAVGWGTSLEDLDADGWLDIFVTNGHVDDNIDQPYAELPGLWRNLGGDRFQYVAAGGGAYFAEPHVGRAVAFGDLDNDGAIDLVVTHKDAPAAVLHNDSCEHTTDRNAWVQLNLVGTRSNRDAIGTRVELEASGRRLVRHLRGGKSYLSAHDLRLTIGLGAATSVERLTVFWPSGAVTTLEDIDVNSAYTIRELSPPSPPSWSPHTNGVDP